MSWLTVQNEPLAPSPWEACYYSSSQQRDFIGSHLGPALAAGVAAQRHPPVSLLGFDDQKDAILEWADALLDARTSPAAAHTAGLAYHWYAGDHFDRLAAASAAYPDKVFLGTEATYELTRLGGEVDDSWVRDGVWARGEGYGHAILGDLLAGSSGWVDWNLLLDTTGGPNHLGNTCDAPVIADTTTGELFLHPQYFYLGHFSKFVTPGSRRIRLERAERADADGKAPAGAYATPSPAGGVYNLSGAVAYGACPGGPPRAVALRRTDGRVVVVVLNCADSDAVIRLEDGESGRMLQRTMPPRSIQTYVLSGG